MIWIYIIVGAAALMVILVGREIVCWYFKINEHLDGQKKLIAEIRALRAVTAGEDSMMPAAEVPITPEEKAASLRRFRWEMGVAALLAGVAALAAWVSSQ